MKNSNQKTTMVVVLVILASVCEFFLLTAVDLRQGVPSGILFLILVILITFQFIGWDNGEGQ